MVKPYNEDLNDEFKLGNDLKLRKDHGLPRLAIIDSSLPGPLAMKNLLDSTLRLNPPLSSTS